MTAGQFAGSVALLVCVLNQGRAEELPKIDFRRDVQPLFKTHCIDCHGPDEQKNGFRLDRRRDAMRGGTGTMIGRGDSAASRLYLKLIGDEYGPRMPPEERLSAEQIKLIKDWIDQGAPWPDELSGEAPSTPADPRAARMMTALRDGNRPTFRNILKDNRDSAGRKGPHGSTPLMYAVLYGTADDVRLVLEAGGDPNARNDVGATALMWAADDSDKTRLLLRAGADPNARTDDGRTPLLVATTWPQSLEVVKLLLDRGADPSLVANSYRGPLTPLRLAAEAGNEAAVSLLLDRGADAKALGGVLPLIGAISANDRRCTNLFASSVHPGALQSAALFLVPPFATPQILREPWAVKKLIESGASAEARDKAGRTVLMLAVTSEHASIETIETLIQLGADVNASTKNGKTVLDFARQLGNSPIVEILIKAGAKRLAGVGTGGRQAKAGRLGSRGSGAEPSAAAKSRRHISAQVGLCFMVAICSCIECCDRATLREVRLTFSAPEVSPLHLLLVMPNGWASARSRLLSATVSDKPILRRACLRLLVAGG